MLLIKIEEGHLFKGGRLFSQIQQLGTPYFNYSSFHITLPCLVVKFVEGGIGGF